MHRDAAHVPAYELHLADVDAGAEAETLLASARWIARAQWSARRPSKVANIPSPVVVTSRPPNRSSSPDRLEVIDRGAPPGRVPHSGGGRCGVDQIREEELL